MPLSLKVDNKCFICKNNSWTRDKNSEKIIGLVSPYRIYKCKKCKVCKINPYISEDELLKLYSFEYFNKSSDVSIGDITTDQKYSYKEALELRLSKFKYTINILKRNFPKSRKFLDIGAAFGDMTSIAIDNGLDAQGIELSAYCREKALKEKNIKLLDLELKSLQSSSYDLIHLNHVFEHFVDPSKELNQIKRVLKNNGGLYIEVPFQFNFVERLKSILKKRNNFGLHSIHHPFFYSPKNISKLLKEFNFEIVSISIFNKNRYPNSNLKEKIKCFLWYLLSKINCGNYVEIISKNKK